MKPATVAQALDDLRNFDADATAEFLPYVPPEAPKEVIRPKLRLSPYVRALPLRVMPLAKEAALAGNWTLSRWVEFQKTAFACLTEEANPEEMKLFLRVVEERFDVS